MTTHPALAVVASYALAIDAIERLLTRAETPMNRHMVQALSVAIGLTTVGGAARWSFRDAFSAGGRSESLGNENDRGAEKRASVDEATGDAELTRRTVQEVRDPAASLGGEPARPTARGGPPPGAASAVIGFGGPAAREFAAVSFPPVVREEGTYWSDGKCPLMPVSELTDESLLVIADTMIGRDDLASYPAFDAEFRRRGLHERPPAR